MLVIEVHTLRLLSAPAPKGGEVVWRTMLFTLPDGGLGEGDRSRDTLGMTHFLKSGSHRC